MTISANISAKAILIIQERLAQQLDSAAPTPTADELGSKGVAAVLGGNTSPAWKTYMSLFASNDAELRRLVPEDGTTDPARQTARAYLVSNGVCTIATTGQLLNNVTKILDLP